MNRFAISIMIAALFALVGCQGALEVDSSVEDETSLQPETANFAHTRSSHDAQEQDLLSLHNRERTSRGLAALKVFYDLEDDALRHSAKMKRENNLHHNPDLSAVTPQKNWRRVGENVGVGHSVSSLHDAFMNSSGHRQNILGDFTHIGIGFDDDGSRLWVTVVFMKAARAGLEDTYGPFVDDDFSTHEANIHKIFEAGITYGCGGGTRPKYCPDQEVTRGEMAAFIDRALGLPDTGRDHFDDDDGRFYETHANRLAAAGITYGCGERRYCGDDPVTRGEMAAFLDRALDLGDSSRDHFDDDDGRFYETHANRMAAAGITYGCGDRRYCGERPVTRAEMASFLARALNL